MAAVAGTTVARPGLVTAFGQAINTTTATAAAARVHLVSVWAPVAAAGLPTADHTVTSSLK